MMKNYGIRLDKETIDRIRKKHKNLSLYLRTLIMQDLMRENRQYNCCEQLEQLKSDLHNVIRNYENVVVI